MKNFIALIIAIFYILIGLISSTVDRYPYVVSKKIMEISNIEQVQDIKSKQYNTKCYNSGPEELTYPEKTFMLDYNYYIVVEFKTNCDLGDTVGLYKKYFKSCHDYWGCSMSEYTYRAKVEKWKFKLSLWEMIM